MGSCTRMARNSRFMDHFTDPILQKYPLKPGAVLTVKSVTLCDEREEVWLSVMCETEDGRSWEFIADHVFDPEHYDKEEVIEELAGPDGWTDLSPADVEDTLYEAKLFEEPPDEEPSDWPTKCHCGKSKNAESDECFDCAMARKGSGR